MHVKRTVTIALGGGALAAWLAGAATSNRPLPDPIVPRPAAIDLRGDALAAEIARLQERLRPTTVPHSPGRDVFRFYTRPAPPPAVVSAPRPALVEAPVVVSAPLPPLRLSGIAEDPGDDGPVRIAFVAGEGQLFMVKEGDPLTPRYKVGKISADAVELVDVNDGSVRRLALK